MTKEKSKLFAFSLIEILVVLAIIGIISAVGIPTYNEYTKKTKIRTAYTDGKPAQTKVAGIYAKTGSLTKAKSKSYKNSATKTYDFLIPTSDYTSSIEIVEGKVVINLNSSKIGLKQNASIILDLNSDGSWSCSATSEIYSYVANCEQGADPEGEDGGETEDKTISK